MGFCTQIAESKIVMADFYYYKRKTPEGRLAARVLYNEAITLYPESDVAKVARARLAEVDAAEARSKAGGGQPRKKFLGLF